MKKIGLLVPSLNDGGAERVVSRLSQILSSKYNVYIIVYEDTFIKYEVEGTLINLDVKAQASLIAKPKLFMRRMRKLKNLKKELELDIVISFLDSPNFVNIMSSVKSCKAIISIRNFNYKTNFINKFLDIIKKQVYPKADFITTVSEVIRRDMIEKYQIPPTKIKSIYNPYDVNEINSLKKKSVRDEHQSFFENGFFFVSMGRNTYQKGFWHLVKAFKIVNNNNPETKLVIIGRDETNGKAQKLAEELDLENKILFTGSLENPFSYIDKSDVYVLSSLFEGFPNALVEALACGCPVIATDSKSGPREILYNTPNFDVETNMVEKADYGVLVPPFNRIENWSSESFDNEDYQMASGMLLLYKDSELRSKYSKLSLERANHFNYERCGQEYRKVIEEV